MTGAINSISKAIPTATALVATAAGLGIAKRTLDTGTDNSTYDTCAKNAEQYKQEFETVTGMGLDQKDLAIAAMSRMDLSSAEKMDKFNQARVKLTTNPREALKDMSSLIPDRTACKMTSEGLAVMAEGWDKPIVFPDVDGFKWLGWADEPEQLDTNQLWTLAYGKQPDVVLGAVGNSNIKPEQVKGGCSLSKKELSQMYEQHIQDFYNSIIDYFKSVGVKADDIGFAFAHSDCGVDRATRAIVEKHGLKGFATTPTMYTQYLRGTEYAPTEEFPKGYIKADFPFPTVLTRRLTQVDDYAALYGKMVGKNNPLGIFGGGEHAFAKDSKFALFEKAGATPIPYDIVKEEMGYEIPGLNDKNVLTNASRYYLEKVNGNPYAKYKAIFDKMPDSPLKEELKQNDAKMAISAIMYSQLHAAGKI